MGELLVVGAAIVRDGRLLAAARSRPPELAGLWELPGGKVEPGEYEEQALIRECREELGVEIAVQERVGGDWPLEVGAMRVWIAEIVTGEPRPLHDHSALRWLGRHELYDIAWIPADLPVVAAIRAHVQARTSRDEGTRATKTRS